MPNHRHLLFALATGLLSAFTGATTFANDYRVPAPPWFVPPGPSFPFFPLEWDSAKPWFPREQTGAHQYHPGPPPKQKADEWVPAIVLSQPKDVQRDWEKLRDIEALNTALRPGLPHPFAARAELWVKVRNRDDGLSDLALAAERATRADLDIGDREQLLASIKRSTNELLKIEMTIHDRVGASAAFAAALESMRDKDYRRALQQLTDAVDLNSSDPVYWYFRAACALELNQQDRAIHDARSGAAAERQYSRDETASINQRLEALQGRGRAFVQGYREGLIVNRFEGGGSQGLASILRDAGDRSAEDSVRESVRKADKSADPLAQEPEPEADVEPKLEADIPPTIQQLPRALQTKWLKLTELMKTHPNTVEIYSARALIWETAQAYEEALKDHLAAFNRSTTANPNKSKAQLEIMERALGLMNRMPYPIHATSPTRHFWAGYEAYFNDDLKKALGCFDYAVQQAPLEPLHWYYRALTYKRQGDDAKAERDARIGAQLERRSQNPETIGERLTRVQGSIRQWLSEVRRSRAPSPVD
jgi:tetratricopeptide (TPR) repeat protein